MKFTEKAGTVATHEPKGLSPNCIGKIVRIQLVQKTDNTQIEHVGLLESYTTSSIAEGSFGYKLKGRDVEVILYSRFTVEVVLYEGDKKPFQGFA